MFTNQQTHKFKQFLAVFVIRSLIIGLLYIAHPAAVLAQSSRAQDQIYLSKINAQNVFDLQSNGQEVVVAIADEGINFDHPDLKARMWTNPHPSSSGQFASDVNGWNFISNSANVTPMGGHGTKLAGIIAGNGSGVVGIAKNVKLMSLIACSQTGCQPQNIISAIYYAADHGAQVVNLSLGETSFYEDYNSAIAYAYSKGAVVVAAAGDGQTGRNLSASPISPVCNDNNQNMVLGAGAVDLSGKVLPWSNFGNCVDIAAPGNYIYTTFDSNFDNGLSYGYVEGSSYAAAQVSGLAAALKSIHPEYSPGEIISKIKKHAHNQDSYQNQFGSGLIDADATLNNEQVQGQVKGASFKIRQSKKLDIKKARKPKLTLKQ